MGRLICLLFFFQGIVTELGKAKELIGQCHQHADIVCQSCGKPGAIEIRRQLEDLIQLADDVSDIVQEKSVELRRAFYHVTNFRRLFDVSTVPTAAFVDGCSMWWLAFLREYCAYRSVCRWLQYVVVSFLHEYRAYCSVCRWLQ